MSIRAIFKSFLSFANIPNIIRSSGISQGVDKNAAKNLIRLADLLWFGVGFAHRSDDVVAPIVTADKECRAKESFGMQKNWLAKNSIVSFNRATLMAASNNIEKEKVDGFLGISCYRDEVKEWEKWLVPKREKMSRVVRAILNREVELKKQQQTQKS